MASVTLPFLLRRMKVALRPAGRRRARGAVGSRRLRPGHRGHLDRPRVVPRAHGRRGVHHRPDLLAPLQPGAVLRGRRASCRPGVPLDALPRLDFALLSHDHYDHTDRASIAALAARGVRFFVPTRDGRAGARASARRRRARVVGVARRSPACACTACPRSTSPAAASPTATAACGRAGSWKGATRRFYHAGDTGYFGGFAEIGRALRPHRPRRDADRRLPAARDDARRCTSTPRRRCARRSTLGARARAGHALRDLRPRRRAAGRAAAALPGEAAARGLGADRAWVHERSARPASGERRCGEKAHAACSLSCAQDRVEHLGRQAVEHQPVARRAASSPAPAGACC